MTNYSGNGWAVLESAPNPVTILSDPPLKLRIRSGSVAVVLTEVARRFHNEVESLDLPGEKDEWGWAYRPVRGRVSGYSNHASATAIDLNATRHPRGVEVSKTFTSAQISRIRAILASMYDEEYGKSIIRWGGDYKISEPDGMHFEIADNVTPAMVARVADRITTKHNEEEDDGVKLSETVNLGPGSASVLNQPDKKITVEESIAVRTASAHQTNLLLTELIEEIRELRQQIGGSK